MNDWRWRIEEIHSDMFVWGKKTCRFALTLVRYINLENDTNKFLRITINRDPEFYNKIMESLKLCWLDRGNFTYQLTSEIIIRILAPENLNQLMKILLFENFQK